MLTESSFEPLSQIGSSVTDIRSRDITSPTMEDSLALPSRLSSLGPLVSEMSQIDFQFPRRFSSMQALRDNHQSESPFRPVSLLPAEISTPLYSPPPIHKNELEDKFAVRETERDNPSPLPVLANTKSKMRRPNSMQMRTSLAPNGNTPDATAQSSVFSGLSSPNQTPNSGRPFSITSTASSGTLNQGPTSPPISLMPPHLQRLKADANTKALGNRRSMPTLVNGPPPAPPPDCALPPLPPGSGMRSPISVRNSVQV
jgi:hypothetical protein